MTRTARLLAGLLVAAPAWAMEVDTRYSDGVDFSRYRTFSWEAQPERPPGHPLAPSSPLGGRITGAVEKELAAKGLRKATAGEDVDLEVGYNGFLEDLLDAASVHVELADGVSWVGTAGVASRSASKGTLILRLVDGETGEPVWSGWATEVARTPEKLTAKAETAVRKILARFPP